MCCGLAGQQDIDCLARPGAGQRFQQVSDARCPAEVCIGGSARAQHSYSLIGSSSGQHLEQFGDAARVVETDIGLRLAVKQGI